VRARISARYFDLGFRFPSRSICRARDLVRFHENSTCTPEPCWPD